VIDVLEWPTAHPAFAAKILEAFMPLVWRELHDPGRKGKRASPVFHRAPQLRVLRGVFSSVEPDAHPIGPLPIRDLRPELVALRQVPSGVVFLHALLARALRAPGPIGPRSEVR